MAPEHIEILGRLDQILTITNYVVTPFVGLIPHPYKFELNPHEVEEIIVPPLAFIMNQENVVNGAMEFEGRILQTEQYDYHGQHHLGSDGQNY